MKTCDFCRLSIVFRLAINFAFRLNSHKPIIERVQTFTTSKVLGVILRVDIPGWSLLVLDV